MSREHDNRPRKSTAGRKTTDGMEQRSENLGDTGRGQFNLRTEQRTKQKAPAQSAPPSERAEDIQNLQPDAGIFGDVSVPETRHATHTEERGFQLQQDRSAPHEAPKSVRETIARHNQTQARKFTEHAAKDEHAADVIADPLRDSGDTAFVETENKPSFVESSAPQRKSNPNRRRADVQRRDTETVQPEAEQPRQPAGDGGDGRLNHDSTHRQHFEEQKPGKLNTGGHARLMESAPRDTAASETSGAADRLKRGSAYQRRFEEHRAEKLDMTQNTDAPPAEPIRDAERQTEHPPAPEQQPRDVITDERPPVRDIPLSHEKTRRSAPNRPGRLIHDRAPTAPKESKKRQPTSPDTVAYIPPGTETKQETVTDPPAVSSTAQQKLPESPNSASEPPKAPPDRGAERSGTKKPGKLRFDEGETVSPPDKPKRGKLEKAQHKAERSGEKLKKAQSKLPTKRKLTTRPAFDEKKGKPKPKLHFEKEVKTQHQHLKGPLVTRPVKAAARSSTRLVHSKVFEAEHENVGLKAAHRAEMLAEGGLRTVYRLHKTAPYRKIEKLGRRTTKLNMKASYQQTLRDNPKLKGNPIARMMQKRKIKRQYAKAARDAKKAGKNLKRSSDVLTKIGQAIGRFVARHPLLFAIVGGIFLLVVIISALFTSCSSMGSGIGGAITAASYLAQDADADSAELYYTEWETDLLLQINRTESDYSGYDEYRYQADNIGHNPYELMAFLTAVYQEFTYSGVEAVLRQIFAEQYQLTFTPSVETRYTDGEEPEPYDWHVMTVTLTSRPFTVVITPRMNTEQRQHYEILMRSKGNRQYAGSPFEFNWLPYVSSYYGYRVHPISGAKDYHKGIDVAIPTGTDIRAAHDGTVYIGNDPSGFGLYITLTGADGLVTNYAHLDSTVAVNGQTVTAGDVIAKSGNSGSSTGPHLHFEIIKDGQYLNPLYFSLTNDTGSFPVYGTPGAPMGDGSFAALLAVAEAQLGKPYVWGAAGPNSFDCSGFTSYVLNTSGVTNIGRQTAQGLYNMCVPIPQSALEPGDLVFLTGTYSAAHPVTHVGIYIGGGTIIHAGNPVGYAQLNSTYWQSHYYAAGRIAT
ncbi:MAG: peptidoglycan DD-metalloendopeptidase family protein [Oscillospiraceae bacterium]|nr:peptidoglycan DD-metalloendopeptidase family protein [Oscillospiraceae bacterium]